MIVKGLRIRSKSGISRIIRHLQNGDDNDAVAFLRGTPADMEDMHRDAVAVGSMYSVRHWIVAPQQAMTRHQMGEVLDNLAREFSFDPARAVVVEHQKQRAARDATDLHWHVMVGEVDPVTGRILVTSFDRLKHELISRVSEFAFGHAFVQGKHTKAVIRGLRKRKLDCVADCLEQSLDAAAAAPMEAFTHAQHQEKKRQGLDLPALRQVVALAASAATTTTDLSDRLAAAGLAVKAGDKPGTWVVVNAADGVLIGALHRLAGMRKHAVSMFMQKAVPCEPQEAAIAVHAVSSSPQPDKPKPVPAAPKPEVAASVTAEPVAVRLAEIEQSALRELERVIQDFEPTTAMREARDAGRVVRDDLSRIVMRRSALQMQIDSVPPVRWWSRFTGSAKRQQQKMVELENLLDEVEAEVRRKEMAITICLRKELREERAARERHAVEVMDIVQRQRNARMMLAVLEHAKSILEEQPDAAVKGLDFVLSTAKTRFRHSEAVADELTELPAAKKFSR